MFVTLQLPYLPQPNATVPNTASFLTVVADASSVASRAQMVVSKMLALLATATIVCAICACFIEPSLWWGMVALGIVQVILAVSLLISFACNSGQVSQKD